MELRRRAGWMCLLAWCSWTVLMAAPEDVVVRGRDLEIRRAELEQGIERFRLEALNRGQVLTEGQLDGLRGQYLDQLILLRLCAGRAEEADRVLARIESRKFIAKLKQQQGEEGYRGLLKRAGYTEAQFEADKLSEFLVTAVVDREVKTAIRIPSQDVRAYYEANADKWIEPASVRYLYLQFAASAEGAVDKLAAERRQLAEWRTQLDRGKDFSAVLADATRLHAGRVTGGERRSVRGELSEELERVVFSVEPGRTGPVVESGGSQHLIHVLERVPPRRLPLEKVEEDIRAVLIQRESPTRIAEYLERLRKESKVEVLWQPGR